jgi:hypothetical protein
LESEGNFKGANGVVERVLDWVFKREKAKPDIPHCRSHHVPMQMRGVVGRPTRFSYQTEETYTVIYFCPVPGCDETAETQLLMTQIPVPGAAPRRPDYARRD